MNGTLGDVVVPVMDLLRGRVVHAVGGRRHEYRSVCELGLASDQPLSVARWYADRYGLLDLYVADLDALSGAAPDWRTLRELAGHNRNLFVDAGWTVPTLTSLESDAVLCPAITPIIGVESLTSLDELERLFRACPRDPLLSLDLMDGLLWNQSLADLNPQRLVRQAYEIGFRRLLLLDLSDVGGQRGNSTVDLFQGLQRSFPLLEIWTGGGVRGAAELEILTAAGFHRILLATALYCDRLSRLSGEF